MAKDILKFKKKDKTPLYPFTKFKAVVDENGINLDTTLKDINKKNPFVNGTGENSAQQKGTGAEAIGESSLAEGYNTKAYGNASHAEGQGTQARGDRSHAEGYNSSVDSGCSAGHAEGSATKVEATNSHAEGYQTRAAGIQSHAEGRDTTTLGNAAHAEGYSTNQFSGTAETTVEDIKADWDTNKFSLAKGQGAHVEGRDTLAIGERSHAEGLESIADGSNSHAEGQGGKATANNTHVEGYQCEAKGLQSHAEGRRTTADGNGAHAEGYNSGNPGEHNVATGNGAHVEGYDCEANGDGAHAEGQWTKALERSSHAEGQYTSAIGTHSHAEGYSTLAERSAAHAEGQGTSAKGPHSHAEGQDTTASGENSHAEGYMCRAIGDEAHAEGQHTTAIGNNSHVEGQGTSVTSGHSHAEGYYTQAKNINEHAEGRYNKSNQASFDYGDDGNTQHSVGIGTSESDRKNAFEIMQNGDAYLHGLGGYDGTNPNTEGVQTLQQEIGKKYEKPYTGIPASDIAEGVIPDVSQFITRTVNDLTNYYLKSETYTKDEVAALIGAIQQFHYEVYTALPTTGESNVLYLIGPTGTGSDLYEEYVYSNGWVKIGDTSIDLSGYARSVDIPVEKGSGENSVQQKDTGAIASGIASVAEGGDNLQGGVAGEGEELLYATAEGYASHAEGAAHAIGRYSHAEGGGNAIEEGHPTRSTAEGQYSHAEGSHTYAKGGMTHAEGNLTIAEGYGSHAEGSSTISAGNTSHAEGINTVAGVGDRPSASSNTEAGNYAHAEGNGTQASGNSAHAEGKHTLAEGSYSHAEGINTRASGQNSHAEGHSQTNVLDTTVAKSNEGIIEDWDLNKFTLAKGAASHAEGKDNLALGSRSHAEGYQTIASGANSHSENYNTIASGANSHAEGASCEAKGERSHVEGFHTETTNASEHAEGSYNKSNTDTRHSIGIGTSESDRKNAFEVMKNGDAYLFGIGDYEGNNLKTDETKPSKTVQDVIKQLENDSVWEKGTGENSVQQKGTGASASGEYSHAEGTGRASGHFSHAEGRASTASGRSSHVEGWGSTASGEGSHAEGIVAKAYGEGSHAEGDHTKAHNAYEHAEGKSNISHKASDTYGDAGNTQHSVGIGAGNSYKNAFEIMQNGDAYLHGLGGYDGTNPNTEGVQTLQQEIGKKYEKPSTGIPASDIATGVIPDVSQFITRTVNDLTNYYLKSETYTKDEVEALIGAIQHFHYEVYTTLPATGKSNVLYLIGPSGTGSDKYEEYVYAGNTWTKIGDTSIDLSGYVTTQALNTALADYTTTSNLNILLAGKQNTISDLATIRSGAAAGATAYQKPSGGIPASDMAAGVIPDVSQFITRTANNLANYYLKSETYTKSEVESLIGAIQQFHYEIYAALPATGKSNVLYLIGPTGTGSDKYEEYVYASGSFVKIGDTSISLSGYVTTQALNTALAAYTPTANKVNEWQSTPDNTHYPSEKLVYDSIAELTQTEFNTIWNNAGN